MTKDNEIEINNYCIVGFHPKAGKYFHELRVTPEEADDCYNMSITDGWLCSVHSLSESARVAWKQFQIGPFEEWRPICMIQLQPWYRITRDGRVKGVGCEELNPVTSIKSGCTLVQYLLMNKNGKKVAWNVETLLQRAWDEEAALEYAEKVERGQ